MNKTIKRELEVAFSKDTQPIWFRITKWIVFISVGYLLHGTRWFWIFVIGILVAGTTMHFIIRWKTKRWTEPWGKWTPTKTVGSL